MGIVSTRLRPWIDIGFHPLRCVLDNESLIVEFELELFNSGSAPARAVLVEASVFDAGPAQDQQVRGFFANPVGEGERIVLIPPLKRIAIKTRVATNREQLQAYELAGREVFVPIIGFNALYSWSGGGRADVGQLPPWARHQGREDGAVPPGPGPPHLPRIAARLLPSGLRQ